MHEFLNHPKKPTLAHDEIEIEFPAEIYIDCYRIFPP